jgi:FixJ family two-component response regulator/glycine cleavage system H lipoate-binding protein
MAKKARILVVDDEPTVGRSIVSAIADKDLEVESARSGQEALGLDGKDPYQVVITDLMMPGMDGMELLGELKKRRPEAMVVMITGFPSVKTAVESVKLGAFDYITKPFTPAELRAVVRRALARQKIGEGKREMPRTRQAIYAIPENTWARLEPDGSVRVGMHPMFLDTIGHIGEIELPQKDDQMAQGQACVRVVDSRDRAHRLWSPVSGRVSQVNEAVKHDLKPLAQDPFGAGWLFAVVPENLDEELKSLLPLETEGN